MINNKTNKQTNNIPLTAYLNYSLYRSLNLGLQYPGRLGNMTLGKLTLLPSLSLVSERGIIFASEGRGE